MGLSVIIPANNEEDYIGSCLDALLASEPVPERHLPMEIIVVANGCTDQTAAVAKKRETTAKARGWYLTVLDLPEGSKTGALNAGDRAAQGESMRVYIDADVLVDPALIPQLAEVLDQPNGLYASGRMVVGPARSWISRAYSRVWERLPYMVDGVTGCGVYAVSPEGRARWRDFPTTNSDDIFVRLQFTPQERREVPAAFLWPLPEGFRNLVRVRRRADVSLADLHRSFPQIATNVGKRRLGLRGMARLALAMPLSFPAYVLVVFVARTSAWRQRGRGWTRGR